MSILTDKDELIEKLKLHVILLEKELKDTKENRFKVMIDAETQYEPLTLIDEFNLYKENNEKSDLSIADMIRETSENYLSKSGYCYDEKTGLYYHSQSGYYYDPINSLFYNPLNGCYYSYDSDIQEYKFHSQDDVKELSRIGMELIWTQGYQHKPPQEAIVKSGTKDQAKYSLAPCIRLINEETGTLAIITCSGGSVGSDETKSHTVTVNNASEYEINLKISYDVNNCQYFICRDETDTSEGISVLNDLIITKNPQPLDHCSKLVINSKVYLLIHIHEDYGTCNWCEPGQVKEKLINKESQSLIETELDNPYKVNKWKNKNVVNQLKVKYGLKGAGNSTKGFWRTSNPNAKPKYIDRALIRRNKEKKEKELETVEPNNAALKIMSKMGWNPGESLGKLGTGISEPIEVYQRLNSRAGIGCEDSSTVHIETDYKTVRKIKQINATQKRYNALFDK